MIISRTPYRISFLGGGTDYPSWYEKYGGQVISTTIDKYVYISCRYLPPFFEHRLRLVYSKAEYCKDINDLTHPSAKAVLKYLKIKNGLEIHYDGDLPARSGIGSSSSFTVGILNAVSCYKKNILSKRELIDKSIEIEQRIIKENVGSQDQTSVANGGFNHIRFEKDNNIIINKIKMPIDQLKNLESMVMLFHTGVFRVAEKITKNYASDLDKKYDYLSTINSIVDEGKNCLKKGYINEFAKLLNQTWDMKKRIDKSISNSHINSIYETGLKNGAIGGKLLGAGGGGFMAFIVPKSKQKKLKEKLNKLLYVPIKFEKTGSKIIYNLPQKEYKKEELSQSKFKFREF